MQHKIKTLASDTLVYGVSTIAGRFLTFMLTPLYSNFLSAGEIGDVAAIYAMIAFVNIVYSIGLESSFMRFWKADKDTENRRVFGVAFYSILFLGIAVTGTTLVFADAIANSAMLQLGSGGASFIRIAAFIPFFDAIVLIPFAQLRMQRKSKRFALFRLFAIAINVSLNILFVVSLSESINGVVWAGLLSSGLTALLFIPSISTSLVSLKGAFQGSLLREMLMFGLPTVPSNLSSIMVQVADRPIMLMLTSSAMVGMYQTNFRLAIPMMMFVTVFEYAWKPFYLNHREDDDAKQVFARIFTLFTIICGAIFLITTVYMPYVVQMPFLGGRLINPLYWSGMFVIPIVMFAYYFNGMFINMAAGFHITKKTKWFPLATGVAAIVNVAATFLLIPSMGMGGAAWAKVAAYVSSALILYVVQQRIYPINYDWKRITTILAICGTLFFLSTTEYIQGTAHTVMLISVLPFYLILLIATGVLHKSTLQTLLRLTKK